MKKSWIFALATLVLIACGMFSVDSRAASFSVYAQIGVGDILQLRANGAKSFTWTSSDESVATVSSDGVVMGEEYGTTIITAKSKKKSVGFKISVVAQEMDIREMELWSSGECISYKGDDLRDANFYIDGKKVEVTWWRSGGVWHFYFDKLTEGEHTVVIKKYGFKKYTFVCNYEKIKVDGIIVKNEQMYPVMRNGIIWINMNPEIKRENAKSVKIDGKEIEILTEGISGSGYYFLKGRDKSVTEGTHTLTVTVEGFGEETITIEAYSDGGNDDDSDSAKRAALNDQCSPKLKGKKDKKVSLYFEIAIGETVNLMTEGTADIKWSSSKKEVAAVNQEGFVKGRKKGKTTVTAMDTSSGEKISYVFSVAYKMLKINEPKISGNGEAFIYKGDSLDGAEVFLDGKKTDVTFSDPQYSAGHIVTFTAPLAEGHHTLICRKKGYKDYYYIFEYKMNKNIFAEKPRVWKLHGDVHDSLYLFLNPNIDVDSKITIKLDDVEVQNNEKFQLDDTGEFISAIVYVGGEITMGNHTVTVTAEGFGEESMEITPDDWW